MKIYIDIGNTNIKINFVNEKYNNYISLSTKLPHSVDSLWLNLPSEIKESKCNKFVICSVVPELTTLFEGLSKKYFGVEPLTLGYPLKTGIKLNVDDPKSIGNDLIALSIFVSENTKNGIIVNLGTATTITHIKNGTFMGTIIMAGINTQLNALVKSASKIGGFEIKGINKNVGRTTKEALSIGIINSHIFAIKEHVNRIDSEAKVFISGGNAKLIGNELPYHFIKEATIEGMKAWDTKNEK